MVIRMLLSKMLSMALLNAKVVDDDRNGIIGGGVVDGIVKGDFDGAVNKDGNDIVDGIIDGIVNGNEDGIVDGIISGNDDGIIEGEVMALSKVKCHCQWHY